ncbi:tRNA (adenosine(37)-N6)-threonylcarbamoyltransferase complex transferase subunit TsaD [Candidatus Parcubacteria bacterium]|nr:tRNA (adenosine(37)-N6)-threonylcarbamoyltransferase complex transferase subunit TsaD [Candidatus Parcubacteria bacterium]
MLCGMRILAIETSCDETAIAIVEAAGKTAPRFKILSNVVSSQVKTHAPFGGVVPNLAKREHQRNLVPVVIHALREAKLLAVARGQKLGVRVRKKKTLTTSYLPLATILEREPDLLTRLGASPLLTHVPAIDALAVTIGPGLAPALWVGVNFARALAYAWGKPLIPVNHMEAHLYSNFYGPRRTFHYPIVCLTVSGGHTQLIVLKSLKKYRVLGETRDDAAGEAFDKGARLLGIPFPGGPHLAKLARQGNPAAFNFPRPMINPPAGGQNHEFSFAGLKTALLYLLRDNPTFIQRKADLAASFEAAIVDVLVIKTMRAAREHRAHTIFLAGGVAANQKLRRELRKQAKLLPTAPRVYAPERNLSTDNAVMVAMAAAIATSRRPTTVSWQYLGADANLGL